MFSKSVATNPAPVGGVTDVKVINSPKVKLCDVLFTVTVVDVFVVVNVAPDIAVSKGVIS